MRFSNRWPRSDTPKRGRCSWRWVASYLIITLVCSRSGLLRAATNSNSSRLVITPFSVSGIYELGEAAGWKIALADGEPAQSVPYSYVIKKNNFEVIKAGDLEVSKRATRISVELNEPAMLYATLSPKEPSDHSQKYALGSAVAPTGFKPCAPRPNDFDSFWASKIKSLHDVPIGAETTSKESGNPDVEYATIRMDNIEGGHIHGQIAKPKKDGKFPALVIFQWASPPYPLQKQWVTDRAAEGWLALNIEPHDVLPDEPQTYYDALPERLKHYESIGNNDRDKCYFLRMYLGDYRAVDYITSRPDWDGKTLVVNGISMGGQQSLCVAGLHPAVTHLIVDVPAGCDTNGPLHGRQTSYPNFPVNDPKVAQTALYFDAVNFAPRIKATSLVAMGFVDTLTAPAGIWTAFNQIQAPKVAVPMVDSPHNHLATANQQRPYTERSSEWLSTLVNGGKITPRPMSMRNTQPEVNGDDQKHMMRQLGIKRLRAGANPQKQDAFTEADANQYMNSLPDVLTSDDGTKITTADQWPKRRREIRDKFGTEIYGRIPNDVPGVDWKVTETKEAKVGDVPTITKTLVGHVDNSAYPQVTVDIQASFTVPANASHRVPLMVLFSPRLGPGYRSRGTISRPASQPWTELAIAHGWGYSLLDPSSIQPDNARGLAAGIIGLTNKGQFRTPDQWGALRAWQWGASRLVDYFEANADSKVDPKRIGIAGVSRYGKAALITEAFDDRVAVALIGSSGAGGAKLYRHIYGEALENLAGEASYWMAGNFTKYAAEDAEFGSKSVADLPVDAHELIALCAPRPCLISYGTVEHGDPPWVDAHGSFMAGVLASPIYALLGKQGFGTSADILSESLPPVGKLVGGELAWRQHDGGHEIGTNWKAFFDWAAERLQIAPATDGAAFQRTASNTSNDKIASKSPGHAAIARSDPNSKTAHQQLLEKAKQGHIDVYFIGDSITRRWGCSDPQYASLLANWRANFFGWNAGNFGWGGDTTANIIWRLRNGELDGVNPKVIVILAGTNDVAQEKTGPGIVDEVTNGIETIIQICREKAPSAKIVATAIFPRNDNMEYVSVIERVNAKIAGLVDGKRVRFLNVNDKLADKDGMLFDGMMADKLHPTVQGYQVWADGLKPILTELLGPPATSDDAPPPTGDPSVQ